ncbi:MAG: hypothetical protein A3J51_00820 [Omnitrophica WOR_2 bacterium RIFCSPHIGHO2_02_FULL_45_21]|nr:MAG: hypothetical protein A3J51_00820 [Omnitrophica WOR_2 bacterium RIFCSPHIGHO2_02_FULL_45_21]
MELAANLSKREKFILAITGTLIIFALTYNFILKPYLKAAGVLEKEIAQHKAKLLKAAHYLQKKTAIEKDFQDALGNLKRQEGVSGEQQIARISVELENLGNLSGIRITDIKPKPMRSYDFYSEFIIEIRFEAELREAAKFIYEIQQSKEILKIEKLQLNVKSSGFPLLEGHLQVHKLSL